MSTYRAFWFVCVFVVFLCILVVFLRSVMFLSKYSMLNVRAFSDIFLSIKVTDCLQTSDVLIHCSMDMVCNKIAQSCSRLEYWGSKFGHMVWTKNCVRVGIHCTPAVNYAPMWLPMEILANLCGMQLTACAVSPLVLRFTKKIKETLDLNYAEWLAEEVERLTERNII